MAERISRRGVVFGGIAALSGLAAAALVGCESKDGKVNKTPTPPKGPKATETIVPTPTAVPTEAPTVAPTEIPTPDRTVLSQEELSQMKQETADAFVSAYSKLAQVDPATSANLYPNQTHANIIKHLQICSGEIEQPGIPPGSINYGDSLVGACTQIPQEVNTIPGREDILEFSTAIEQLGEFTLAKADRLFKDEMFKKLDENSQPVPITKEEFESYRVGVSAYFPK
ncbi:hypothetical protein A2W15_06220 [Candidatus Woesebacteria bacterium RBG_16_41_13]|nr:MAG: hypothetical protein A2W15_06220 [Candidatus Woesebacteria bacterium RBG_16_41_13]